MLISQYIRCLVYQKSVAVVVFSCAKNLKGIFSELTELLQGVKIVRSKIKKERKKRGYLSGSSLPGPIRQEPV